MQQVNAGDPCPKCGADIIGVCGARFGYVPIRATGYYCLEGDFEEAELIATECRDCSTEYDVVFPTLEG